LALELIGTRYSDPDATFAEHLADGLFNQGLYLGPVIHTNIHTDIHTDDAANLQTMPIKISCAGHVLQEFSGDPAANRVRRCIGWWSFCATVVRLAGRSGHYYRLLCRQPRCSVA
jgi:hypothetical protein